MKTFILELKPKSGLLTELQSDTIYGHFCWRLKERSGDEILSRFISSYHKGNPIFLLSDGFLKSETEYYFPAPFIFKKPIIKANKKDKILDFVSRKRNKEEKFYSLKQLNAFLRGEEYNKDNSPKSSEHSPPGLKSKPFIEEQLRVSVQIDRNNFTSEEGKLFSYSPKFIREDLNYFILVNVIDEKLYKDFECDEILKDIFTTGYGKKKSSGYGHFDVRDLKSFEQINEPADWNAFLVLGNYLPSPTDKAQPIAYEINTKYGKFGEEKSQSDNPFKNPIVFLTAGSCFKTSGISQKFFGRVTDQSEISDYHPNSVQFGCPLFLKFKYNE